MEKGGHFVRMKGSYSAKDVRYTRKGNVIYAIILGWPGKNTQANMTLFGKGNKAENIKVKKVTMIGSKEKIKWHRDDAGLVVTTPSKTADYLAVVFKLISAKQ